MATIKKQLSAANGDLYINRWLIGLYTQRSPLFVPVSALGVQIIARHDSLWDGLNMEISTVMSLVRRFGYSRYCSQAFGSSDYPLGFYSNQHLDGTIYPMVDTPTHVCTFTSSTLTPVFAKAESLASPPYPGAQGSFAKVADTLYYCNGNDANLKKWDGTTVTGWGIQPPAAAPTLTFGAGAGAILSSSLDVAGSGYATNDTGTVNGGTFAATYTVTAVATGTIISTSLAAGGSGYAVNNTGTIGSGTTLATYTVTAVTGGVVTGYTLTFGGAGYSASTNVATTATSGSGTGFQVNILTVTGTNAVTSYTLNTTGTGYAVATNVATTTGGSQPGQPGTGSGFTININLVSSSGTLTVQSGYMYGYSFKNSTSGHVSTMSPMSADTNAMTDQQVTVGGSGSSDPQVDKIVIWRTDDGGSLFYYLTDIANASTWSYTDSTPDAGLNTDIVAPINGINNPPPTGSSLCIFHMGRVWVASGNYVYYGAGGDTTTGVPEESFPPANNFEFYGNVTAMASTSIGLLVFTVDDIYLIAGTSLATFQRGVYQRNMGVASQNCIAQDGDGLFIFTTRGQLFQLGGGTTEIGFAIRAKLAAFNPANVYLALHRSGGDEGLFVSDGSTNVYRYSISFGAWCTVAQPVGGIKALASIEVATGNWQLMAGRASGSSYILHRDVTTYQDDGGTFTAYATVGALVTSPPGSTAKFGSVIVEAQAVGTYPTVSILANEVSAPFVVLPNPVPDPPGLPASTTFWMRRHYLRSAQTPIPEAFRFVFVKIAFVAENAANEITGLALG